MFGLIASEYLVHLVEGDLAEIFNLNSKFLEYLLVLRIIQINILD
jgi:hypothetical protein